MVYVASFAVDAVHVHNTRHLIDIIPALSREQAHLIAVSVLVAAHAIWRAFGIQLLYLVLYRYVAVEAFYAVLSDVGGMNKFRVIIFIQSFRFEMALEASLFADIAVADNGIGMAGKAGDIIFYNLAVVIAVVCHLFFSFRLPVVACFAVT
jgi:hypothetical protein